MKNKNLFFKIYIAFVAIFAVSIIVLSILGKKERVGYLSDFKINVYKTLELNYFINIERTEDLFINDKLDYDNITNYVYDFRIKYLEIAIYMKFILI